MTTDNRTNDDREKLIARLAASVNPLDVTCGECGSKPGNRCYGNGEMRRTHSSRASKAEHELRAVAADALEAATRERDAALEVMGNHKCGENVEAAYRRAVEAEARIAELEKSYRIVERLYKIERQERIEAEARIAEAAKLHRNAGLSQGYDSRFRGGYGMLGDCCASCGSHGEYGVEWPCPTIEAIGGDDE